MQRGPAPRWKRSMTQSALREPSSSGPAASSWPAMSISEAHALLTAPGSTFEMEELEIGGRKVRVWKNGPKTLVEVLYAASAFGDRTFIVHEDERVSFDALCRAAQAFAKDLIARGVQPGDRVVLATRNLPEWPAVFYGAALAGAIATPLNAWWSSEELIYGLKDSGAAAAVFDAERYKRVRDGLGDCPDLRHQFLCRRSEGAPEEAGVTELETLLGRPNAWGALPPLGEPPRAVGPEDPATIFYTSGTTGEPKGAMASHRAGTTAILASALSQARAFLRGARRRPRLTRTPTAAICWPSRCFTSPAASHC